ncbi:AI-2E family transporter [Echinicola marina]|uniref:AI-2E family transporter n=1 Tax=Echinicola marina TaxID=2859768 RepID=UPI001CF6A9CB|nr:AI-2E family transporter [Echinicola marina]UCS92115.1 AI-2E family transporter [Echinicola marina]
MNRNLSILQSFTYFLIALCLIFVVLKTASFIFIPVAWSALLAIALLPVCDWMEEKGIPRQIAIIVSILLTTLLVVVVIYVLANQLVGLLKSSPAIGNKLEQYLVYVQDKLDVLGVQVTVADLDKQLSSLVNTKTISSFLMDSVETIMTLGIMPVLVFFFMYYQEFFMEFLRKLQMSHAEKGFGDRSWIVEASGLIKNYLIGLSLVTIIVFVMASVVFYLLGVKYFLFFALFVSIFNLIPYIGVFLSSLISVVYVLLITDSIIYPLLTLLLLWGIQLIENNLITPMVVGMKIKLNPLAVILAIILGGWTWGISGVMLFIPLMGVIKIVFDHIASLRPFGYLLGNEMPEFRQKETLWTKFKQRWSRKEK